MYDRISPAVDVTIGGETRIYHAFITTAPIDARRAVNSHAGRIQLRERGGFAADPIPFDEHAREGSARLVLIGSTELDGQTRALPRRSVPVHTSRPVLVGLNTLQQWLWQRLAMPSDRRGALMARRASEGNANHATAESHLRRSHHEYVREDHPQRSHGARQARGRRTPLHRRRARWPEADRVRIWARQDGTGQNVTFPARQFTAHGQRRSFSLLRAINDPAAQDRLREFVLQAYVADSQQVSETAETR